MRTVINKNLCSRSRYVCCEAMDVISKAGVEPGPIHDWIPANSRRYDGALGDLREIKARV